MPFRDARHTPRRKRDSDIRSSTCGGAFTLIELLVVVAIIALLLSILLPSLQRARDQAKQLQCNTNLRSMGQASFLYAEDNDGWVVRSESWFRSRNRGNWGMHFAVSLLPGLGYSDHVTGLWDQNNPRKLQRACRAFELFQCPSFPEQSQALDYNVNAMRIPRSLNNIDGAGRSGDGDLPDSDPQSVKFSKMSEFDPFQPGDLIHITELNARIPTSTSDGNAPWGNFHDFFMPRHIPFGSSPRISNDNRHPGGVNALFFDGHATTLSFSQIDPGWPLLDEVRLRHFAPVKVE